jgi:hypothetical protein
VPTTAHLEDRAAVFECKNRIFSRTRMPFLQYHTRISVAEVYRFLSATLDISGVQGGCILNAPLDDYGGQEGSLLSATLDSSGGQNCSSLISTSIYL